MNTLRPEPQTPEIQRELQALQETLNRLSVANDALADKLQPVLSIEQSEGFYAVAGSEPATPLGKLWDQFGTLVVAIALALSIRAFDHDAHRSRRTDLHIQQHAAMAIEQPARAQLLKDVIVVRPGHAFLRGYADVKGHSA
jgi:hypothetical protein